jgi:PPOX class probable F420-dependent enzyme
MRMAAHWTRARFAGARVARLATADAAGRPHVVPIVFAVVGDTIYSAVDTKPKSGAPLRRLANIRANPAVSVLVDHYTDDWSQLWWARADGTATVIDAAHAPDALAALAARYPQYEAAPPPGPVIAVGVHHWSGWAGHDVTGPPERSQYR